MNIWALIIERSTTKVPLSTARMTKCQWNSCLAVCNLFVDKSYYPLASGPQWRTEATFLYGRFALLFLLFGVFRFKLFLRPLPWRRSRSKESPSARQIPPPPPISICSWNPCKCRWIGPSGLDAVFGSELRKCLRAARGSPAAVKWRV